MHPDDPDYGPRFRPPIPPDDGTSELRCQFIEPALLPNWMRWSLIVLKSASVPAPDDDHDTGIRRPIHGIRSESNPRRGVETSIRKAMCNQSSLLTKSDQDIAVLPIGNNRHRKNALKATSGNNGRHHPWRQAMTTINATAIRHQQRHRDILKR